MLLWETFIAQFWQMSHITKFYRFPFTRTETHYHLGHLCRWHLRQRACRCPGLYSLKRAPGRRRFVDATSSTNSSSSFTQDIWRILEYTPVEEKYIFLARPDGSFSKKSLQTSGETFVSMVSGTTSKPFRPEIGGRVWTSI